MPRELKPQKVDSVSIEEKRFDIWLDRNKVEFFIEITDDTKATGASKAECVVEAREMVSVLRLEAVDLHHRAIGHEAPFPALRKRRTEGDRDHRVQAPRRVATPDAPE